AMIYIHLNRTYVNGTKLKMSWSCYRSGGSTETVGYLALVDNAHRPSVANAGEWRDNANYWYPLVDFNYINLETIAVSSGWNTETDTTIVLDIDEWTSDFVTVLYRHRDSWNQVSTKLRINWLQILNGTDDSVLYDLDPDATTPWTTENMRTGTYEDWTWYRKYISGWSEHGAWGTEESHPVFITWDYDTGGMIVYFNHNTSQLGKPADLSEENFLNPTLLELLAVIDDHLYIWDHWSLNGSINHNNPVNYTIIGNATLYCDFDTAPSGEECDHNPVARFNSTFKLFVNVSYTLNGSMSGDPDGGSISNYAWDFGDGNQTSGAYPTITHVWDTLGNYTVSLNVTDNESDTGLFLTAIEIVSAEGISNEYVAAQGIVWASVITIAVALYWLLTKRR
ncbi:MAG: PKD domain-containing protein, partial [Candidatus Aenigmatarchaeota archaeon]